MGRNPDKKGVQVENRPITKFQPINSLKPVTSLENSLSIYTHVLPGFPIFEEKINV